MYCKFMIMQSNLSLSDRYVCYQRTKFWRDLCYENLVG